MKYLLDLAFSPMQLPASFSLAKVESGTTVPFVWNAVLPSMAGHSGSRRVLGPALRVT